MPIVPDTKNWTWVVERPCPQCGFDASTFTERDVAGLVRENAAAWPGVLARPDAAARPDADTWSALEYGAHVRDVFRLFRTRLALMLEQDDPIYPNWNQDKTAIAERYGEQDPATVAGELAAAATALAADLDAVPDDAWERPGRRSDGAAFTVATFAAYLAHDPIHHLWDVSGERFARARG